MSTQFIPPSGEPKPTSLLSKRGVDSRIEQPLQSPVMRDVELTKPVPQLSPAPVPREPADSQSAATPVADENSHDSKAKLGPSCAEECPMTENPASELTTKLLEEISALLDKYMGFTSAQRDICAAWILHTHLIEVFDFTPYLWISSPVKRCGKTRLLFLLQMTKNSWLTGRTTAAALVRMINAKHPTLLLDESDTGLHGEYAITLQNVMNAGFMRGLKYSVCEPSESGEWTPVDYDVFSPKAIAGIGHLPDTVMDRSIPIQLQRAKAKKAKYRDSKVKPLIDHIRKELAEWEKLAAPALKAMDFEAIKIPAEIEENDRHVDVAEPLLSIADLAGGRWPKAIRGALIEVWAPSLGRESASVRERLLADIRDVFAENPGLKGISTTDLIRGLVKNDDSEWREYHQGGKEITPRDLSRLLKPMNIEPKSVRIDDTVLRGYKVSDFKDALEKYL